MAIVRGITSTISINVTGERFTTAKTVYVTLEQGNVKIRKLREELEIQQVTENGTVTGVNVKVHLSADETKKMKVGGVQFQIRWEDQDGNVCGSKVVQIPVGGSLEDGKE